MKRLLRNTVIALCLMCLPNIISAQCGDDNIQLSTTDAGTWVIGQTVTLSSCIYGGEYILVNGLQDGSVYSFSTCGDSDFDTQITLYDDVTGSILGYNDDFCGLQSTVDFVSNGNPVRVLIDKFFCSDESTCMTLQGSLVSVNNSEPCTEIITLVCGQSANYTLDGVGVWNPPSGPFGTPGDEQVFSFTATTDGLHTVSVVNSGSYVDLFSSSSPCSSLGWTFVDDIFSIGANTISLVAGQTILFLLDDEDTNLNTGSIMVTCPAPSVDPCASITDMDCGISYSWSSVGAGVWNPPSPWGTPGGENVFTYTPAFTGSYTLSVTHSSTFYVDLFVANSCSANAGWTYLTDVFNSSNITVSLTAGVTYYFLIDDEDLNASNGTLSVSCPCIPPPGGIDASYNYVSDFVISDNTAGACDDCDLRSSQDRVYEIVLDCAGSYTFTTCGGASWDTYLYLTSQPCGGSIIALNDDACGLQSSITASLQPGTYYINVEGFSSFSFGPFDLSVSAVLSAPTALCQNTTVNLDENGVGSISISDIDAGSDLTCLSNSISVSQTEFDCDDLGDVIVTLTVSNDAGTDQCEATVTVEDNIAPDAVCQDITIQLDENGEAFIVASDIDGGSTDNCGIASLEITSVDADWNCDEVGENTVTLTVSDVNSNVSTCEATVTVEDNLPPILDCPDIVINLDPGLCGQVVQYALDATDNCSIASEALLSGPSTGTYLDYHDSPWTVEYEVSDASGNTTDCSFSITMNEYANPTETLACNDLVTIALDEDGCSIIGADMILEGGPYGCYDDYIVDIEQAGNEVCCETIGSTLTVVVTDPDTGNTCMGSIQTTDALAPECDNPIVSQEFVVNGDFETGDLTGWTTVTENTDDGGYPEPVYVVNDGSYIPVYTEIPVAPINGNFDLVSDQHGPSIQFVSQPFTIPSGVSSANLSWYDRIMNYAEEFNNEDQVFRVELLDASMNSIYEVFSTNPGDEPFQEGPNHRAYDLTSVLESLEGEMLYLSFYQNTQLFWHTITIDDVSLLIEYSTLDYTIDCSASIPSADDASHPFYPQFYDNCGIESISLVSETTTDADICTNGGITIEREWTAIDVNGNAASSNCVQTITIARGPLGLPASVSYDCAQYDLEDLVPALTGEPTGVADGCMYSYAYADVVLPSCGSSLKVNRTWTILDMCTDEITTHVQIIELLDTTGPTVDATDMAMGTDADQCASTGWVSLAAVTDDCSGVASVSAFAGTIGELEYTYDGSGAVTGGYIPAPGLELGEHDLTITATDGCGNQTTTTVTLSVSDDVTPTAVCDEITQVALGSDGTAEVFAETFDDGSHDNCCLDGFDVRRMDGAAFGASVSFDCADTDQTIQVILRVHDCHGNTNSCMVEVLVEDKQAPYLATPANDEITCETYHADLAAELDAGNGAILETMFGAATYGDNCEAILDYSYTYSVDQCGNGSITRTWTVNDPSGNGPVSGSQTITISHVSNWSVSFPGDLTADCVDGQLPDFGEPTVTGDNCELIAISHTDTQYDVVPDACYKIVREWEAINWCTYPDEAAQTGTQVIKVTDSEAPVFDVEDITVEITEADCDAAVTLPTPDVTDCSDDITITTTSDLPAGEAGPGTYTANYVVSDGCGNYSYDQITITVVDAKKPTPYVTDHLVTEIMQTGMTQLINVNDFDIGSFDNCSDVTLSFSPDVTDTEVQFTCDDLGDNTLEVWVTDAAGNQDFATVTLEVQDNMNVCGPGSLTIAGALATQEGEGIEDATVEINGGLFNHTTDETGTYSFDLEAGADYSVVPSLDLDVSNGVTTFDIVLITQHILGMNTFSDAYQYIAADANNSNSITTLDAVAIRMVILQLADAFPNNTSWRFVDADHVFADPTDPWGYPEVINYNNLDVEDLAADFIGVKIGDVNGTAQANFQSPAENRTNKNIQINTTDEQVQAGQEVTVHFTSTAAVSGYQFTLNHEGLELVSIQEGLARTEHFGVHAGALTASWNDMEIRNLAGEDLFSVTFKATTDVQLSEVLTINSRYTQAEAYTTQGIEGVELTFSGQANADYVLYQNVPNPFNGQTTIGFDLAKAGQASLTIMTIDGQTVKSIIGDFAAGYNEVIIKDLRAVGVLYYSLESGDFTATKKMIVIE